MDKTNIVLLILLSAAIERGQGCYCEHYPWGQWSSCSKTCYSGTQSRHRQIKVDEYYRKNFCDQLCTKQESQVCNQQACPINCQLGDFGAWSECDPCVKKQLRVKSLLRPSQFGGQPCTEPMVDSRRCFPTKLCNIEEVDCQNKFQCDNGRCLARNLECNGENDCGDNSDERNCRQGKPVCNRRYESIPSVQLMGNGFHLLAGESRGEILDNSFNGGKCRTVKSKDTRKTFRVPANLETVSFQVENEEDDVESDFYDDLTPLSSSSSSHSSGSGSGKSSKIPNSNFIRVHKVISVSNFTMKQTDLQLSGVFLKALNNLPLEYNYALYSRMFDEFGTHYYTSGSMGGTYDLLYQYSAEELKNSGLTKQESNECVRTETTRRVLWKKKKKVHTRCTTNKMTERYEGSFLQSSERSISLVKVGRSEYAAALAWEKRGSFPEHAIFTNWLESTKDNPIVIDFDLASILDLVKNFPCAVTKRRNLRRALIEYMERFDPCKCTPCPNNGRPMLSGTRCLCVCQAGTYGDNCEKRAPDYKSVAVDGYWSCWSTWSSCDVSFKRRRTRMCNNPSPLNGGKPCEGESQEEEECYISLFADNGALCINDDESKREEEIFVAEPESGCLKPEPPENGFIRNEKNHYSVGEEAEIVCMSGYNLVGFQFFRCLPDQTWAQQPIECQSSVCPRPSASDDVSILPFKSEYKMTETIQLSCPAGFIVTGLKQYTCGRDLAWTPPILKSFSCEKDGRGIVSPQQKVLTKPATALILCRLKAGYGVHKLMPQCARSLIIQESSQSECFCLMPYQCSGGGEQSYCIQTGSTARRRTASLCALGAMKCAGMTIEVQHEGRCLD
uniref:Complement component C6 n=1 Tax=Sphenodon punctatus TaxID=8508 RepID=A0A8D0HCS9_SPHPU